MRTGSGHATIEGKKVTSWYVAKPAVQIGDIEETRLFTPEEEAALKDIGYGNC